MIKAYTSEISVHAGGRIGFHLGLEDEGPDTNVQLSIENVADRSISTTVRARVRFQETPRDAWLGFNWSRTLDFDVPSDWPSGFYRVFINASGETKNLASFVVRPRPNRRTSNVLVHVSYLTPAAYNNAGGKSFYSPRDETPSNQRARKVSFDRPSPYPRVAHDSAPNDFINEAKLLEWLTAQGITFECCSSIDLHADPELLDEYSCLVLAFHDEYWTKNMRDHVERFIRNGGNLVSLSGNTCYRQVRLEENDRTVVFYKKAGLDPFSESNSDEVTVAWAEPPVNRPQNSMLGVGFTHGAFSLAGGDHRGYEIRFPDHWVFEGVSDAQTSRFLHYETDAAGYLEEDEGYPRVTGDENTPLNLTVLASADLRDWQSKPGRATMTVHSKNGTVFNGGSTNWINALETDEVLQRITRNVFFRLRHRQPWTWEHVGHARHATAMTSTGTRLYLSTEDNKLWRRFPVGADVPWADVGHANGVRSLAADGGTLYCATHDNIIWARPAGDFDADWQRIGFGPDEGVSGLAVAGGMLYATDASGALYRRPASTNTHAFELMEGFEPTPDIVALTSYSDILFASTRSNRLLRTNQDFIAESSEWVDLLHCNFSVGLACVEWMLYVVTNEDQLWRLDLTGLSLP